MIKRLMNRRINNMGEIKCKDCEHFDIYVDTHDWVSHPLESEYCIKYSTRHKNGIGIKDRMNLYEEGTGELAPCIECMEEKKEKEL